MKKTATLAMLSVLYVYCAGQPALSPIALAGMQHTAILPLIPIQLPQPSYHPGNVVAQADAFCTGSCSIILPLTALELQGTRLNNQQVLLNWTTRNETNSRGFDIERSPGDAAHFSIAGSVATNSGIAVEKKYKLTDNNSYSGLSFYRVKQIDIDGNYAYSNTVQIKGFSLKNEAWLSPNPASGGTILFCYAALGGTAHVKLLTEQGQELYQQPWVLSTGSNSLKLNVSLYAKGIYYVQVTWPGGHASSIKLAVE